MTEINSIETTASIYHEDHNYNYDDITTDSQTEILENSEAPINNEQKIEEVAQQVIEKTQNPEKTIAVIEDAIDSEQPYTIAPDLSDVDDDYVTLDPQTEILDEKNSEALINSEQKIEEVAKK